MREAAHLHGERGCLPECCRAPQDGRTPLHLAWRHAAVAKQLLAAGADVEAKFFVSGEGVCGLGILRGQGATS